MDNTTYAQNNNNTELDQTIDDFNSVLYQLAMTLANTLPDSLIGQNKDKIEKKLNDPDLRDVFINIFTSKVLKYKPQIEDPDEDTRDDFFLNKSFNDDLQDHQAVLAKIFEFKNIWRNLRRENRQIVVEYMKILCQLSQEYFLQQFSN